MSWTAPANRQDLLFLEPSLRYCGRHLEFIPELVVGDMAYSDMPMQRRLREETGVGIITRLRPNLDLPKAIEPGLTFCCSEGQPLEWLGLIEREQLHWFAVRDPQPLCCWCPQQSSCSREFSLLPPTTRLFLERCRFSRSQVNAYCGRCVAGLRQINRMRRTNWGWAKCILTACAFAGP